MRQGHAYEWRGQKVLALESGEAGLVGVVDGGSFSARCFVQAAELVPLPMVYFGGRVP